MKRRFGKRPPLSEIEPGRLSWLSNLAVCPDGTTVSVRDGDRLRSWDTATGREIDRKGLGHVRGSYAISPDGKRLFSVGDWPDHFGELLCRDPGSGEIQQTYGKEGFVITTFRVSPKGQYVAVGSREGTYTLFEVASGKEIRGGSGDGSPRPFTPDGKFLVTSTGRTDLLVMDVSRWVKE